MPGVRPVRRAPRCPAPLPKRRRPRTWRSVRHPCLTYRAASCRPDWAAHPRKPPAKFWSLDNKRRSLPPGRDARLYGRQGCPPPPRSLVECARPLALWHKPRLANQRPHPKFHRPSSSAISCSSLLTGGGQFQSGGGPPQSRTLARGREAPEPGEASWTAPALWRFGARRIRETRLPALPGPSPPVLPGLR